MIPEKVDAVEHVTRILGALGSDAGCLPASYLYNEGWMLRLVLDAASAGLVEECIPPINAPAKWASEVKLYTPFDRSRGSACEGPTSADGVVGNFDWAEGTRTGVALLDDASRFEVFEAKMFSSLSPGVTAAKWYDQAVRTIACMAQTLARSNINPREGRLQTLRFWVVAPQAQLEKGIFEEALTPGSLRAKVRMRIAQFSGQGREELELWHDEYFAPLVQRLTADDAIRQISWERLIECISCDERKKSVEWFYQQCSEGARYYGGSVDANSPERGCRYRAGGPYGGETVVVCSPGRVMSRVFVPGKNQDSFKIENSWLEHDESAATGAHLFIPLKWAKCTYKGKQVRVVSNGPCRSKVEYLDRPGTVRLVENHLLQASSEEQVSKDG